MIKCCTEAWCWLQIILLRKWKLIFWDITLLTPELTLKSVEGVTRTGSWSKPTIDWAISLENKIWVVVEDSTFIDILDMILGNFPAFLLNIKVRYTYVYIQSMGVNDSFNLIATFVTGMVIMEVVPKWERYIWLCFFWWFLQFQQKFWWFLWIWWFLVWWFLQF